MSDKFSKLLEVRNCDFLEQLTKIEILPVYMIKQTTEKSKMFVKIFYDLGKAEIQIFSNQAQQRHWSNQKIQVQHDLPKRLNINISKFQLFAMYTQTALLFSPKNNKKNSMWR